MVKTESARDFISNEYCKQEQVLDAYVAIVNDQQDLSKRAIEQERERFV